MSPLSNATTLANYASGIGTQGATLEVDSNNKRVGIGTTNPQGPEGSLQVGTAVTISGNSGIVSATTFHGDFGSSTSVAGNLNVSGVITYEDVTNVDSIGIMTARSGISVPDNQKIQLGAGNDLQIYHTGSHSLIDEAGTGNLTIRSSLISFEKYTNEQLARFTADGSCELFHNNSKKLETTSTGVSVTGSIGIGLANPSQKLHIQDSSGPLLTFDDATTQFGHVGSYNKLVGSGNIDTFLVSSANSKPLVVRAPAGQTISFDIASSNAMRLHSTGQLFINHNAESAPAGWLSKLQLCDTSYQGSSISLRRDQNSSGGPALVFAKSRSSSKGGNTVVQNGDNLGNINFYAADGTDVNTPAATINCRVDGTPGGNDIPGRLVFSTTADGSASPTERMRIDSSGRMGLGTNSPLANLQVGGYSSSQGISIAAGTGSYSYIYFADGSSGNQQYRGYVQYNHATDILEIGASGSERMRIDSSGRLLVGTTTPGDAAADNLTLHSSGDTGITIRGSETGSSRIYFADGTGGTNVYTGAIIYDHATNHMSLHTNSGAERLRIDSSGRLLVNTSTSRIVEDHVGNGPQGKIQIEATNSDAIMSIISAGTADANRCGTLSLGRHRNSTVGATPTIVQDNDSLGAIVFAGGDGNDMRSTAAKIHAEVDGTPGQNDMPGALVFSTTPDGSSSPYNQERMRIDSSGDVGIGNDASFPIFTDDRSLLLGAGSGSVGFQIYSSTTGYGGIYFGDTNSGGDRYRGYVEYKHNDDWLRFAVAGSERMRIDSSGRMGLGTNSPSSLLHVSGQDTTVNISASTGSLSAMTNNTSQKIGFQGGNAEIGLFKDSSGNYSYVVGTYQGSIDIPLVFRTGNRAERMRINSAGSLLVGTTSTSSFPDRLITAGDHNRQSSYIDIRSSSVGALLFADGLSGNTAYRGQVEYNHGDDSMRFWTQAQERMRLTNNGNLTVNSSSVIGVGILSFPFYGQTQNGLVIKSTWNGNNASYVVIRNHSDTTIGSITATTTATSFNTSSDYRLKENVVDIADGITRVKQLQPKRFNFIADAETTVDGFLAHEAQTVVPEAVTGTHNEVEVWQEGNDLPEGVSVGDNKLDDEGNTIPVMQGIDQAKLVPLLTAALKEAIAEIESLKARVTVLEG